MADSSAPPKVMMDLAPSLRSPGFRLVEAGEVYTLFNSIYSVQAGIPARGTTQLTGFKLTAAINNINHSSGTDNSVVLPPGLPGKQIIVYNNTLNNINVFATGADMITPVNSSTPGASVAQIPGSAGIYLCVSKSSDPTVWKQISIA